MKYYILASVIIFGFVIMHATKRGERKAAAEEKNFWDREAQANNTRKKPIDHLPYIKLPLEAFPMHLLTEDSDIAEIHRQIQALSQVPILNLTGYSNTDLKLEYGTANITVLSEYDQNYTTLVSTLQKWAEALIAAGYDDEAKDILEFALSTNTDVSATYYCLAKYYIDHDNPLEIDHLIAVAEDLRSSNSEIIVRTLKESYQFGDWPHSL